MSLPYSKKVIEHFMNPKNVGEIDDPDAVATEGSPACGDMVKIYLKIDPQSKVIKDIKFKSYGCASNIATASIITEIALGKTIYEIRSLSWKDADKALGGLPPVKVHCAVLAVDALKTAVENYEHTHGLLKEKISTTPDIIRDRLTHVIDPIKGTDVIRSKIIQDIFIERNVVYITLKIPEDHQFAKNIKEEIVERIQPLWDVKEVKVIFGKK